MKKHLVRNILLSLGVALLVGGIGYYLVLPPLNLQAEGFWVFLAFLIAAFVIPFCILNARRAPERIVHENGGKKRLRLGGGRLRLPLLAVLAILAPIAVVLIGSFISSTLFHAKAYAGIVKVEEAVFHEDMPETDTVTNIALMDSDTASVIGNRTLGSLASVVSQYGVAPHYTQINYLRSPKKVANLEYLGFFKWIGNRDSGIPGYVMVDPVKNSAEYVELEKPMRYADSGYLGDDLMRKLRFDYPTKIFDTVSFEIDEEGNPYYIVSCLKPQVMMFGASDVTEVIVFNPCDGSSELLSVSEAPAWIDCVYNGYLACEKYDWNGLLSGGYWNSVIGNVGCKQTTDDFGYIVIEDDVWYFTGVTSVTADESNIGFIISNARTGEYKFYPVVGAEEYSAMGAAEGEVQEKGYTASFPSLVNISGEATYIMVLKDANSIVKLYALVNVENYSIVATGATQDEVMAQYRALLVQNGVIDPSEGEKPPVSGGEDAETVSIVVRDVRVVTVDGNSVLYITAEDGRVYKGSFRDDETLILIQTGDRLALTVTETEHERIFNIVSWREAPPEGATE